MGKKVFWNVSIPETVYGWLGLVLGITGGATWCTQFIWDWFGETEADKALYSLIVLLLCISAIAFTYTANRVSNKRKTYKKVYSPIVSISKIIFIGFVGIILVIMALNGGMMTMNVSYSEYAEGAGLLTGIRQLSSVTSGDVNSLANFGLGIREIVKAMFMIVPALIATWGGLGVLTADSISDAEGGILAIVAAFVVFIVVWIFKAIDVTIMFMTI